MRCLRHTDGHHTVGVGSLGAVSGDPCGQGEGLAELAGLLEAVPDVGTVVELLDFVDGLDSEVSLQYLIIELLGVKPGCSRINRLPSTWS